MLNITDHQGNENQNHFEMFPHCCNAIIKQQEIPLVGEDVEKKETFCTLGSNVN